MNVRRWKSNIFIFYMEYRDFYTGIAEAATEFLPFSDIRKKMWYHGRSVNDDTFSLDYVGSEQANDQEGPGFYFTNALDDARKYAGPAGSILLCKIKYVIPRLLSSRAKPSDSVIARLIKRSPDKLDTLSNFAEDPNQAYYMALRTYREYDTAKDAYQIIANDFYKGNSTGYLQALRQYYDGHLVERGLGVKHLVVYRPDIIQIINKFKINTKVNPQI